MLEVGATLCTTGGLEKHRQAVTVNSSIFLFQTATLENFFILDDGEPPFNSARDAFPRSDGMPGESFSNQTAENLIN
jgi:hypothetical protein